MPTASPVEVEEGYSHSAFEAPQVWRDLELAYAAAVAAAGEAQVGEDEIDRKMSLMQALEALVPEA